MWCSKTGEWCCVMKNACIPSISVRAGSLPEAWEKTVLAVWDEGLEVRTEYDKPGDAFSRDATVMVQVDEPFSEPRIHKNFPGGPIELEVYRQEVINGIHDHWIDPAHGKWSYTYHQRLFAYGRNEDNGKEKPGNDSKEINQIDYIVNCLSSTGYSRRAQAITWMPASDPGSAHPPCLQRIWCRLIEDASGQPSLNMNAHWRSRDLYKAWFMNAYALTELQRIIAEKTAMKIDRPVKMGGYVDVSDSLHIYGSDIKQAELEVEKMRKSSYSERSWHSSHQAFRSITQEAQQKLTRDPDWFAKARD